MLSASIEFCQVDRFREITSIFIYEHFRLIMSSCDMTLEAVRARTTERTEDHRESVSDSTTVSSTLVTSSSPADPKST